GGRWSRTRRGPETKVWSLCTRRTGSRTLLLRDLSNEVLGLRIVDVADRLLVGEVRDSAVMRYELEAVAVERRRLGSHARVEDRQRLGGDLAAVLRHSGRSGVGVKDGPLLGGCQVVQHGVDVLARFE